jgi:hypothetical protein
LTPGITNLVNTMYDLRKGAMIAYLERVNTFIATLIKISVVVLVIGVVGFILLKQRQSPFLINTDRVAVIKEIQSLERLETAQFTIEKVIDAQTEGTDWERFLFGDRLLLIAHARIIAGVDFAKLTEENITVDGKKITIQLPASELFVTDLDESKTQVYDRQKGLLTKGEEQLETQARRAAEITMSQAACEGGILTTAAENAEQQIETLLKAFEFEEVTVTAPVGSC